MPRDLEQTLQALYDSEINVTITWMWDNGIEFAFGLDDEKTFQQVHTVAELADALHEQAIVSYQRARTPRARYRRSKS